MTGRRVETVVIGAGPGGYVAAIRAAQLGRRAVVVERGRVGGVCLNAGCIPSKALIHAATLYDQARQAAPLGITAERLSVDLGQLIDWKDGVVRRLADGVARLLQGNRIETLQGEASFLSPRALLVRGAQQSEEIEFEQCIIATGSRPIELAGFAPDGRRVLGSTEALARRELPRRAVVLGGGYIGLEIGTLWCKLGSEVTVVEVTASILPGAEADCARVVARNLKKRGVRVLTNSRALALDEAPAGARLRVASARGEEQIECDVVLSTVGRQPLSGELRLERAGVRADERGFIAVDERQRTSVPGIYAIGDVAGPPLLAHKASHEALAAAAALAGTASARRPRCVPAVVFTDPEIASVGLTEAQARAQGIEVVAGKFPFAASGRALTMNQGDGFAKVVAEKGSGRVLGAHVVGPNASEIIGEMGLAVELGATLEDVAGTVHAHPTLPETLMEAAEAALGRAIHLLGG